MSTPVLSGLSELSLDEIPEIKLILKNKSYMIPKEYLKKSDFIRTSMEDNSCNELVLLNHINEPAMDKIIEILNYFQERDFPKLKDRLSYGVIYSLSDIWDTISKKDLDFLLNHLNEVIKNKELLIQLIETTNYLLINDLFQMYSLLIILMIHYD